MISVSDCLSAHICPKPFVQTLPNFLNMSPLATIVLTTSHTLCTSSFVNVMFLHNATDVYIQCLTRGKVWCLWFPFYIVIYCNSRKKQQQRPFWGPLSGTTRVSRYQNKHSPTHVYYDHQPPTTLSASSIYYHPQQQQKKNLPNTILNSNMMMTVVLLLNKPKLIHPRYAGCNKSFCSMAWFFS